MPKVVSKNFTIYHIAKISPRRPYSVYEIKFIKKWNGIKSNKAIGKSLGRSGQGIGHMKIKLGIAFGRGKTHE